MSMSIIKRSYCSESHFSYSWFVTRPCKRPAHRLRWSGDKQLLASPIKSTLDSLVACFVVRLALQESSNHRVIFAPFSKHLVEGSTKKQNKKLVKRTARLEVLFFFSFLTCYHYFPPPLAWVQTSPISFVCTQAPSLLDFSAQWRISWITPSLPPLWENVSKFHNKCRWLHRT